MGAHCPLTKAELVPDEPTLGEVLRRLEAHERRSDQTHTDIRASCATAASTHVDSRVYEQVRQADKDKIADLQDEVRQLAARVTWAWRTALVSGLGPMLVGTVVWIATRGNR